VVANRSHPMTVRTTKKTVTFANSFKLESLQIRATPRRRNNRDYNSLKFRTVGASVQRWRENGGERAPTRPSAAEGSPEVTRRTAQFLGDFGVISGAENVRQGRNGGGRGIRTPDRALGPITV